MHLHETDLSFGEMAIPGYWCNLLLRSQLHAITKSVAKFRRVKMGVLPHLTGEMTQVMPKD